MARQNGSVTLPDLDVFTGRVVVEQGPRTGERVSISGQLNGLQRGRDRARPPQMKCVEGILGLLGSSLPGAGPRKP